MNIHNLKKVNDLLKQCSDAVSLALYFAQNVKVEDTTDLSFIRYDHCMDMYQSAHEQLMELQYGKVLNGVPEFDFPEENSKLFNVEDYPTLQLQAS
jgi:hypothetical protein